MICTDYFLILKEKVMNFGQLNYDLGYGEFMHPQLPFKDSSLEYQNSLKAVCYDSLLDIFKRIDKIEKEYSDLLFSNSSEVEENV